MIRRLPSWLSRAHLSAWRARPSLTGAPMVSGLLMRLMLGAAVVLTLTSTSPTAYRDAPAIIQADAKDKKAIHGASIKKLPVVVLALEGEDAPTRSIWNDDGLRAMRERMAVNILLRSGYLSQAVVQQNADHPMGSLSYAVGADENIGHCARLEYAGDNEPDLSSLAIAVVAAEKFNRSGLHRFLELHLADAVRAITGRLPDMSLGVAQVRPSTIRRYVETSPALKELVRKTDDASLRVLLMNECESLRLSAAVLGAVAAELRRSKTCAYDDACLQLAVLRYGGHRHRSEAVVDYLGLVWTMKGLLETGNAEPTEEDAPAACEKAGDCDTSALPPMEAAPARKGN
jgi:hypothetical protein